MGLSKSGWTLKRPPRTVSQTAATAWKPFTLDSRT